MSDDRPRQLRTSRGLLADHDRFAKIRAYSNLRTCVLRTKATMKTTGSLPYDEVFFDRLTEGSLNSARVIVPLVLELSPVRSVVDIGCGRGAWLKAFQEQGVALLHGYDGDYVAHDQFLLDPSLFSAIDLQREVAIPGRFDLAVCLEVGEHLPGSSARGLVEMLTNAAPLVLFSAAIPGQGGTHHVNEQWPSYWRSLFAEREYCRLDPIRPHIWRDRRVARWYRQNLYLYASAAALSASQVLQAEATLAESEDIELIDSLLLNRYKSIRGILGEVPRVIWRAMRRRLATRG